MSPLAQTIGTWICPALMAVGYAVLFFAIRGPDAQFRNHWHDDEQGRAKQQMGPGGMLLIAVILALSLVMVVALKACAGTGGDDYQEPASRWE